MVALATGYAFRGLFEDTASPKCNKQPNCGGLHKQGYFSLLMLGGRCSKPNPPGQRIQDHPHQLACPCLIAMNHGLKHHSQTQFWKKDKFTKKYSVHIEYQCRNIYLLSISLLIHLPINWTTKFHMKETKESRNRDPYLTIASRKPAVQVRKETDSNL